MNGDPIVALLAIAALAAVLAAAGELGRLLELLADRRHIERVNRWRDEIDDTPTNSDDPAELAGRRVVRTTPIN